MGLMCFRPFRGISTKYGAFYLRYLSQRLQQSSVGMHFMCYKDVDRMEGRVVDGWGFIASRYPNYYVLWRYGLVLGMFLRGEEKGWI